MARTAYYEGKEFTLYYEVFENVAFMHCEVASWTLSTLKKCYLVLGDFLNYAEDQKFLRVATITPNPKFAKLFGGTSVKTFKRFDTEYEVIIWDLTPSLGPQLPPQ